MVRIDATLKSSSCGECHSWDPECWNQFIHDLQRGLKPEHHDACIEFHAKWDAMVVDGIPDDLVLHKAVRAHNKPAHIYGHTECYGTVAMYIGLDLPEVRLLVLGPVDKHSRAGLDLAHQRILRW